MRVEATRIPAVKILHHRVHRDERGFFLESYSARTFREKGIDFPFVQDNHAASRRAGTVRGLHFQAPPFAQDKLVRVASGAIFDVAVDLRPGSRFYGEHVAVELRAGDGRQLLVPRGFAHGYCTLEPDTSVLYKVTAFYAPDHQGGLLWSDPRLDIDWPVGPGEAVISDRDRGLLPLAELETPFRS